MNIKNESNHSPPSTTWSDPKDNLSPFDNSVQLLSSPELESRTLFKNVP